MAGLVAGRLEFGAHPAVLRRGHGVPPAVRRDVEAGLPEAHGMVGWTTGQYGIMTEPRQGADTGG
jgi:hypothetical protein